MSSKSKALLDRWQRRRARLLVEVQELAGQCRKEGTEDQVHRLRVTLRRLRLALRVGKPVLPARALDGFKDWAKSLAAGTSRVRDLDVAAAWLRATPGAEDAARACEEERERLWAPTRVSVRKLRGKIARDLSEIQSDPQAQERFARRWSKLERHIAEGLRVTIPQFFELDLDARHDIRRDVRRWRYLRELELPQGKLKSDPLLGHLVAVQAALGNQRNLALVADVLTSVAESAQTKALVRRVRKIGQQQDQTIQAAFTALNECPDGWPQA